MNCHICSGRMDQTKTDLPFKLDGDSIMIIKSVPVFQCSNCKEYILEDQVMAGVDQLLEKHSESSELEVIRYAV